MPGMVVFYRAPFFAWWDFPRAGMAESPPRASFPMACEILLADLPWRGPLACLLSFGWRKSAGFRDGEASVWDESLCEEVQLGEVLKYFVALEVSGVLSRICSMKVRS